MPKVVTIAYHEPEFPVYKEPQYKYMIPLHVEVVNEGDEKVYYHTFRVTPVTPDEYYDNLAYGDQSMDFEEPHQDYPNPFDY